jgi:molybdopterin synthase catalytic subunit/molybdopterin converting factor small subunit
MEVTVRLFAALRERAGAERLVLRDLPEPLDVAGLKRALQERHAELGDLAHVRGVLGTRYVDDRTPVEAGQELSLLPPVSGGAPDDDAELGRGVFEIRAEPLDPEEARRRVSHPSCGGCVVFTGTTRARNRERDVVRLDYEAFHEMAEAEMGCIYAECVQRFGPPSASSEPGGGDERRLRMLTLHRSGTVEVGEPSIVIAVASPHRDAAFGACRFLIDELKARVPLWKKELYADGHHWIGDRS